jgi:hypothetical protein
MRHAKQVRMATTRAKARRRPTFRETLTFGSAMVKEQCGASERQGVIILRLQDFPVRLSIAYAAKDGAWEFDTPRVMEESQRKDQ